MPSLPEQVNTMEEDKNEPSPLIGEFFSFIRKRFLEKKRQICLLALGLSLTLFFLLLFVHILDGYREHNSLIRSDIRVANLIYSFRSDTLTNAMLLFTHLGTWQIVFTGLIIIGFILFALNLLPYFWALIISVSGGEAMVGIIKHSVQRPRPPTINALLFEHGFGFPSGHTLIAFSFYGLLAYIIYRVSNKKITKIIGIISGIIMISGIALSRVYLGVHWPSDILASLTLGAAWLIFLITLFTYQKRFSRKKENIALIGRRFVIIPAVSLAFILVYIYELFF